MADERNTSSTGYPSHPGLSQWTPLDRKKSDYLLIRADIVIFSMASPDLLLRVILISTPRRRVFSLWRIP